MFGKGSCAYAQQFVGMILLDHASASRITRKCLLSRAGKLHSKKATSATLLHSTNGIRTTRSFAAFESRTYALSTTIWFTGLKCDIKSLKIILY